MLDHLCCAVTRGSAISVIKGLISQGNSGTKPHAGFGYYFGLLDCGGPQYAEAVEGSLWRTGRISLIGGKVGLGVGRALMQRNLQGQGSEWWSLSGVSIGDARISSESRDGAGMTKPLSLHLFRPL